MPDVNRDPSRARTLVLMEPPFCFWDQSMDRLREGEETIPGIGILVLATLRGRRVTRSTSSTRSAAGRPTRKRARRIVALKPDVVGLSCTTISVTNGSRVAKAIKGRTPGCA